MSEVKNEITKVSRVIKCPCQPLPKWVKWMVVILIITIFILCCVMLHYLWKLSDIWNAVKNLPNK